MIFFLNINLILRMLYNNNIGDLKMRKIYNDLVKVEINDHAAEIAGFYDLNTDIEYMWQGNPEFWANRNPILFPIVGNLYNKEYKIKDKTYRFDTNHGFTRNALFNCIYHDQNKIVMEFKDNEDTLRQYPFKFTLNVIYKLKGKRLTITYTIKNNSDEDMPFSFGLHPAFNVPLKEGERFEDYQIEFSNHEDNRNMIGPFVLKGKVIPLNYELFEVNKTLMFEYLKSSEVKITNQKYSLKMGIVGYRYFAIWTKENAPFICLEPWHGHGDLKEVEVDFYHREGTFILPKDNIFTTSYYIEIE